jgi:hypothetical protein
MFGATWSVPSRNIIPMRILGSILLIGPQMLIKIDGFLIPLLFELKVLE